MLTFDRVSFSYDGVPLLNDVSFTLPTKGAVCFFGPSGCGKTTVLRLIAGLERPKSGNVLCDKPFSFGTVFQENRLLPWLTVRQNVELICQDKTRVNCALQIVALTEDADKYPDELSGGMQRRVAIARALAYDADVLILDEPFNGIDETLCRQIARSITDQYRDRLIVLVTHSKEEADLLSATTHTLTPPLSGTLF